MGRRSTRPANNADIGAMHPIYGEVRLGRIVGFRGGMARGGGGDS